MALQDIINTASNIEINRSKLVAQTVSRSGRISVASRNWANPFRFTVTPKPVWTYTEYRAIFEPIFTADRYTTQSIALTNFNTSTGALTQTGMFWLTEYQGNLSKDDTTKTFVSGGGAGLFTVTLNNTTNLAVGMSVSGTGITGTTKITVIAGSVITIANAFTVQAAGTYSFSSNSSLNNYTATSMTGNSLTITKAGSPTVGNYIFKAGDYLRIAGGTYPYIVSSDVQVSASATEVVTVHRGKLETFSSGTDIYVGRRAAVFNVIVSKLPQIRFLPGQLVEFTSDFEMVEAIL
jgi:hypothetical protein